MSTDEKAGKSSILALFSSPLEQALKKHLQASKASHYEFNYRADLRLKDSLFEIVAQELTKHYPGVQFDSNSIRKECCNYVSEHRYFYPNISDAELESVNQGTPANINWIQVISDTYYIDMVFLTMRDNEFYINCFKQQYPQEKDKIVVYIAGITDDFFIAMDPTAKYAGSGTERLYLRTPIGYYNNEARNNHLAAERKDSVQIYDRVEGHFQDDTGVVPIIAPNKSNNS